MRYILFCLIFLIESTKYLQNNIKMDLEASFISFTGLNKQKSKLPFHNHNPFITLQKILQWRQNNEAPVDIVGCQRLYDKNASPQIQKYQILISLMLSIQTKDQVTSKVVERLKKEGLQPKTIASLQLDTLQELIRQANFHKRKAKNIKQVSEYIIVNGIPNNTKQLMQLPGVGIKISMIYMKVAEGKIEGIGVDTHVHRISNRLGWVNTKSPNQTEQVMRSLFPINLWKGINVGLVGFGQTLCNAKKPDCGKCPVRIECPSSEMF